MPSPRFTLLLLPPGANQEISVTTSTAVSMTIRSSTSVEHWASPAALAAHQRTEPFIHFGQGVLVKYATLHDTVTAHPFDVA